MSCVRIGICLEYVSRLHHFWLYNITIRLVYAYVSPNSTKSRLSYFQPGIRNSKLSSIRTRVLASQNIDTTIVLSITNGEKIRHGDQFIIYRQQISRVVFTFEGHITVVSETGIHDRMLKAVVYHICFCKKILYHVQNVNGRATYAS